jgi:TolB-like protein/Flp pilus assembly protein TadD
LQVLDLVGDQFNWPPIIGRAAVVLAGVGFFATLVAAWFHGQRGGQRASATELLLFAGLAIVAVAGVWLVRNPADGATRADTKRDVVQASIAVLPFADMSAESNQAFFADGIAEEILNVLGRIPQLRVAARTSSFSFRNTNLRMDSIGKALNVAHVLEGSVRKDGTKVRITAKLVNVGTGFDVWSGKYDRDLSSVFAVQDEITAAIVDSLRIRLGVAPMPTQERTSSHSAHEYYLLGLDAWRRRNEKSLKQAASYFERAVAADSAYARAQAGLALTYAVLPQYTNLSEDSLWQRGIAAARRALQLDPRSSEAHAALSQIAQYSGDQVTAEREAREAIRLAPSNATAHQWLSETLAAQGRFEESRTAALRAIELDPLAPVVIYVYALALYRLNDIDGAIRETQRSFAVDPGYTNGQNGLGFMAMYARKFELARQAWRAAYRSADTAYQKLVFEDIDAWVDGIANEAARPKLMKVIAGYRKDTSAGAAGNIVAYFEMIQQRDSALKLVREVVAAGDKNDIHTLRMHLLGPPMRGLLQDPRLPAVLRTHIR